MMNPNSMWGYGVTEQRPLLSTRITPSSSVVEVVTFLKSSFQAEDFSLAAKILTDRENALTAEISELKREKHELKAAKKEVDDKLENTEKKFLELEARVISIEEGIAAATTGGDVSKLGKIIDHLDDNELEIENDELNCSVQNHMGPTVTTVGGGGGGGGGGPNKEAPCVVVVLSDSEDENEMVMGSAEGLVKNKMRSNPEMNGEEGENLKRKRSIGVDGGSSYEPIARTAMRFSPEMNAEKGENLKRKRSIGVDGGNSYEPIARNEMRSSPEMNAEKGENLKRKRSMGIDEGGSYEPIARVKCEEMVSPMAGKSTASDTNLKCQKVGARMWLDEDEMRLAFADDYELCMQAVCALYRKLISAPLSLKPMDRGFEPNDKLGVTLAKYLIDGHPENKLNRSISEVTEEAAKQSKLLALRYIAPLFRIYSSGEDPWFCYNPTSSKPYYSCKVEH